VTLCVNVSSLHLDLLSTLLAQDAGNNGLCMIQPMHIIFATIGIANRTLLKIPLTVNIPAGTVYMLTDQTG